MRVEFADIPLEKAQKDLLAAMVEADRAVEPKDRYPFLLIRLMEGSFLQHAALNRDDVYPGDLATLSDYGMLRLTFGSSGSEMFDVTPIGRQFYEWMKAQEGSPVERLEAEVRRFLETSSFQERHRAAYDRWTAAESELWGSETGAQYTDIGHKCREAIQIFITDLVEVHNLRDIESDPQRTVARLKAVLEASNLSDSLAALAEALLVYFGAVSDQIQRQEHGSQKEGTALAWEDARRVVFQTAMVMFELDRALS